MAARAPLTHVVLAATSVADDLGYVALADLADVLGSSTYRIIGGHMVTALVARWQLGAGLYRETADTDLGVPPVVVSEEGIIGRLVERGYERQTSDSRGFEPSCSESSPRPDHEPHLALLTLARLGWRLVRARAAKRGGLHPNPRPTRPEWSRCDCGPAGSEPPGERPHSGCLVGEGGLEPPRPFGHWHLKPARLPIPPLARVAEGP